MDYWRSHCPPRGEQARAGLPLLPAGAALFGLGVFALNFRRALSGWFYREDSRYFSNGLFSLYDLLSAFLTPHNAMGHYRPITKLYWALPEWLGFADARVYHSITFLTLALAAGFLARLAYLLYGNALLAVLAGALWALMPVNAKPVYWACACQDTTAALFVLAALTFRIQQQERPRAKRLYRGLCLVSVFFALASREVGFAGTLLIFLIDWRYGRLKESADVAALWTFFFFFVFVLNPPFDRAHVNPDPAAFFSLETYRDLWRFANSTLWTLGDSAQRNYPAPALIATALLLAAGAVGAFLQWSLLLAALLGLAGVVPFLLIRATSIEYTFLFGAGLALVACGMPAVLMRTRLRRIGYQRVAFSIGLVAIAGYYSYLGESRRSYGNNFVQRSLLLKGFLEELRQFSATLPPFRPIELVDLGPYRNSEARDSHHFIPHGLDRLVPDRTILIDPEVLHSGEGTDLRDPHSWLWSGPYSVTEPVERVRYTQRGFVRD